METEKNCPDTRIDPKIVNDKEGAAMPSKAKKIKLVFANLEKLWLQL